MAPLEAEDVFFFFLWKLEKSIQQHLSSEKKACCSKWYSVDESFKYQDCLEPWWRRNGGNMLAFLILFDAT